VSAVTRDMELKFMLSVPVKEV